MGDRLLHRRLGKTGPGGDGLQAGADPGPALAPAAAPQPEIDEEGRGAAVVADQVAHQHVGYVGVERFRDISGPEPITGGGRDRPEKAAGKERAEGRAGSLSEELDAASQLLRTTSKRRAVLCRPDVVARSVTMNLHRSLLSPSRTTNASPSRPPPVMGPDPYHYSI